MLRLHFESIDSTNQYLKTHYHDLAHFSVISASHQTDGKGRLGRTWLDDGNAAMFSILLKNNLTLKMMDHLPLLAAVAVHQVLVSLIPSLKIKWPNDMVVSDLKLCGILCESVIEGQSVVATIIGIGINVNTKSFPEVIKETATSLAIETKRTHNIDAIIEKITNQFSALLLEYHIDPMHHIRYCNQYSSLYHKEVSFYKGTELHFGIAQGIDENGMLLVEMNDGLYPINTGEVNLLRTK